MYSNLIVEVLGHTDENRILGFFLEHPYEEVTLSHLSRVTGIHRDTIRKKMGFFLERGYVDKTGRHGPYTLDITHPMVIAIDKSVDSFGDTLLDDLGGVRLSPPDSNPEKSGDPWATISSCDRAIRMALGTAA